MAAPTKSAPKTRIITLSLSKLVLSRFPRNSPTAHDGQQSATSSHAASSNHADANSTPEVTVDGAANDDAQNGGTPSKPDLKRTASQMTVDGSSKSKAKPGPKKKAKVEGPNGTVAATGGPKLNPKASAGAINANLRALDRTGAQCRKWKRAPFQVRSFTGASWLSSSTWEAPAKPKAPVDENGKPQTGSVSGSNAASDAPKPNRDSSAIASEHSQNGDTTLPALPAMSSPAPVAVA